MDWEGKLFGGGMGGGGYIYSGRPHGERREESSSCEACLDRDFLFYLFGNFDY